MAPKKRRSGPLAKKQKVAAPAPVTSMEPVDIAGLRAVASLKAAGHVCWDGSTVSIRDVLLSVITRAEQGILRVGWRESEEGCGFLTRRWSAQSLFALPRALRSAGRCGLHNTLDLDQDNAHFRAQLARHPGRPALA